MASSPRSEEEEDTDEEPSVPVGLMEGIEDIEEGRTADDDDLDDAVNLKGK